MIKSNFVQFSLGILLIVLNSSITLGQNLGDKIGVELTLTKLLLQEDTDGDRKITIDDTGPKVFTLQLRNRQIEIEGAYFLSNLLEILVTEKEKGKFEFNLDEEELFKSPREKISDRIKNIYWKGLTRKLDQKSLLEVLGDTKVEGDKLILYVPFEDKLAQDYYGKLSSELGFTLEILPKEISPEYVLSINSKPGILSLKLKNEKGEINAEPFVVPGGRFNEMYGWDSYFQNKGLLIDGEYELAKSVIENFSYEIQHYGKILNANRSYYLTRTQPPFFSSMILELQEVYPQSKIWLAEKLKLCIQEYLNVWMKEGKRLTDTGLNRYYAEGIGVPWETEPGHFDEVLKPYADQFRMRLTEFEKRYKNRKISVPELDEFFRNDRSVRESGHDTTHRFGENCTHILPVELNCMLLKYEMDIAYLITNYFDGTFFYDGLEMTSEIWKEKVRSRKEKMEHYFWNEELGIYSDYDFIKKKQTNYHAATCYFPLWVKLPTQERAEKMIQKLRAELLFKGGFSSSDYESGGIPNQIYEKQWDYPFGWAPHQIIIWAGLNNYGKTNLLQESVSRWVEMITENAMNYNGTITEKYDVVNASHKVFAEYGNQGTDFKYITKEGFGWMNASFKVGLDYLDSIEK